MDRTTKRLALFVTLTPLALLAGCSTPIAHQAYQPIPVQTPLVRVVVEEVHRGEQGGIVTLSVTNLSSDPLIWAMGSRAHVQHADGQWFHALAFDEFLQLVEGFGPIAMGIDYGPHGHRPPEYNMFDARLNLQTGQEGKMKIAYHLPETVRRLVLNVGPAFQWQVEGKLVTAPDPVLLAVELPPVPPAHFPTKDEWLQNVRVGVSVSSDDF